MPEQLDPLAIRREAREAMQAARVPPLRFTAVYFAATIALSLVDAAAGRVLGGVNVLSFSLSFVSILVSLVVTVLSAGYACYCLRVQRGEYAPIETLLDAFPFAGKVVALTLLQGVLIGVGLTLFVVPGVVAALTYPLALFHLCEEPERGVLDAMRRSRAEMRGRRWAFFLLHVGFLPLLLLAALALLASQEILSPLFPNTLAGDLEFVLASGALTAAAELILRPWLVLARVVFYRRTAAVKIEL